MAASLFLSPPPSNTRHSGCVSNPIVRNPISTVSTKTLKAFSFNTNKSSNNKSETRSSSSDCSFSLGPFLSNDEGVKAPTAPWMRGPLILQSDEVLDLSKPRKKKNSTNAGGEKPDKSLTGKVSGGRGKKALKKILEGMGKLREIHASEEKGKDPEKIESDILLGDLDGDENSKRGKRMPWEKDERMVFRRTKKEKVVTAAELSLDGAFLERLRGEAARMRKWEKVKKAGVTQAVVDQLHMIWKDKELAMLKFDLPLSRNMDRAREIVETKTGGLVVWSKKDLLVIYRGCDYTSLTNISKTDTDSAGAKETSSFDITYQSLEVNMTHCVVKPNGSDGAESVTSVDREEIFLVNRSLYEREADRLLHGLGPRFIDWWRPKPLPIDADLLPEVIPGFKPPARLFPSYRRSKLTDDELTYLRKLARPLPTHFVLGRNRKLQGLAAAILKLWEKCHIAKIAVKWGAPNTNNAEMANELKCLTGGVLLLRNKYFIILYRGKDFLPSSVAELVAEREMEIKRCQLHEEAARLKAAEAFDVVEEPSITTSTSGSLSEFKEFQSECAGLTNGNEAQLQLDVEREKLKRELNNQERKLLILKKKIERSEKELAKVNSSWRPNELDADLEIITEEERECFRKIGLKLDSTLVLGRRGVFDGVIEGLHQHWKHREVVKVITMQRLFRQVIYTAKQLEAESGGIIVSVNKLKEGHAIIIYRGKNYRRPSKLLPQNLLNRKEALRRSLGIQRIGSLKFFAYQRRQSISDLKCKLGDLQKMRYMKYEQEDTSDDEAS